MTRPSPAILLHPADNVVVCRAPIAAGESFVLDGQSLVAPTSLEVGHKIARRPIKAGDKIIKYGAPIGSATADIGLGAHVHLHNVKSDYRSADTRGEV